MRALSRHLLVFFIVVTCAAAARAGMRAEEMTKAEAALARAVWKVERWRGQFRVFRRESSTHRRTAFGSYNGTQSTEEITTGTFVLEPSGHESWNSTTSLVQGSYASNGDFTMVNHGYRKQWSDSGSFEGPLKPHDIHLRIEKRSPSQPLEWSLTMNSRLATPYTITKEYSCDEPGYGSGTDTDTTDRVLAAGLVGKAVPQTDKGAPVLTFKKNESEEKAFDSETKTIITIEEEITLTPEIVDLEMVVDIDGYDRWVPKGSLAGAAPGNSLNVTATLQPRVGQTTKVALRALRFELKDTSKEPGVCMNWPPRGDDPSTENELFDLRFKPGVGTPLGQDGQAVELRKFERLPNGGSRGRAVIDAHDFGGCGDLTVTGELSDGRTIVGELRSTKATSIALPKRRAGSRIAEPWRERRNCHDVDKADGDETPKGDDNKGDGFSTYEEYRGFAVDGKHIRTKTDVKDLFIHCEMRRALPGCNLLAGMTGLEVHPTVRRDEMSPNRRMNPNRSDDSPRSTQEHQHGLIIRSTSGGTYSWAEIKGDHWRPKTCEEIRILDVLLAPARAAFLDPTIAHEILHALGVHHHGEDDDKVAWVRREEEVNGVKRGYFLECRTTFDTNWQFSLKTGTRIRIFRADGTEVSPDLDPTWLKDPVRAWVGLRGQQHAGDVNCAMRYVCAWAFTQSDHPNHRYLSPGEPAGTSVCSKPDGTQFNATNDPMCRYGDATIGGCEKHFGVRDDAPNR